MTLGFKQCLASHSRFLQRTPRENAKDIMRQLPTEGPGFGGSDAVSTFSLSVIHMSKATTSGDCID